MIWHTKEYHKEGDKWYAFHRRQDYEFHHLEIEVYSCPFNGCEHKEFTITFQASKDFQDWYGFGIKIDADSLTELASMTSLAQRLLKETKESSETSLVLRVLNSLESHKCLQRVYDSRFMRYVLPGDLAPEAVAQYRPDIGDPYTGVSCYADTASDAKDEIRKQLAYSKEKLLAYLRNDEPVKKDGWGHAPTFTPAREQLALPWVEASESVA